MTRMRIWATTTPVPPGADNTMLTRFKTRVVIDQDLERQYQEAALQVMTNMTCR